MRPLIGYLLTCCRTVAFPDPLPATLCQQAISFPRPLPPTLIALLRPVPVTLRKLAQLTRPLTAELPYASRGRKRRNGGFWHVGVLGWAAGFECAAWARVGSDGGFPDHARSLPGRGRQSSPLPASGTARSTRASG
jgi:hypothetical protein